MRAADPHVPRWSARTEKCTGCTPPPSWQPQPLREDDDDLRLENTGPIRRGTIRNQKQDQPEATAGRLTESICALVWNVWKSSSFMDTRMLARMPRDVPMPYKAPTGDSTGSLNDPELSLRRPD